MIFYRNQLIYTALLLIRGMEKYRNDKNKSGLTKPSVAPGRGRRVGAPYEKDGGAHRKV